MDSPNHVQAGLSHSAILGFREHISEKIDVGRMQFGFVSPGGDAIAAAEFAHEAEDAGWDGFFVWEPVWGVDAWVSLTAAAMRTKRIRLGTMITPVSRMRPWKLASETAAVDRLSKGRLTISVGLGALDNGFYQFGEETDRKVRAELLDEGLDILTGLWKGQPFKHNGKHYHVKETSFFPPPPPVQRPRIPIWVVAAWPRERSMRRALSYDGILPTVMEMGGSHKRASPADISAMKKYIGDHRRSRAKFDIVIEGDLGSDRSLKAKERIASFETAGATWWIEAMWSQTGKMQNRSAEAKVLERIKQGPPSAKS